MIAYKNIKVSIVPLSVEEIKNSVNIWLSCLHQVRTALDIQYLLENAGALHLL